MKRKEFILEEFVEHKRIKYKDGEEEVNEEERRKEEVQIDFLPTEMLLRIFYFLGRREIFQCQTVCRAWKQVCEDSSLWKHLYFNQLHLDVKWIRNSSTSSFPPPWRFNTEIFEKNNKRTSDPISHWNEEIEVSIVNAKDQERNLSEVDWKKKYKEGLIVGIKMTVSHLSKEFKSLQIYLGKLVHKKHQCSSIKEDFNNQKRILDVQMASQNKLKKSLMMSCGWAPSTITAMFKPQLNELSGMSLTAKMIKIDQLQMEEENTKKKLSQVDYLLSSFLNCYLRMEEDIQKTRGQIFEASRSSRILSQRLKMLGDSSKQV